MVHKAVWKKREKDMLIWDDDANKRSVRVHSYANGIFVIISKKGKDGWTSKEKVFKKSEHAKALKFAKDYMKSVKSTSFLRY